ncbi:MAG: nitroreductase family protein [Thermodesulfobacteriota bacterium]
MPLFTIDQDLCRRDGLCAAVCPASLVRLDDPGGLPYPLAGREVHCIRCGHCVAVCPTGALRHSLLPIGDFPLIDREKALSQDLLTHHLRTRRSIRNFKPCPVPRETFAAILDTVRHAPSGHNHQPVAWTILDGRTAVSAFLSHAAEWMREEVRAKTPLSRTLSLAGAVRAVDKGKDVVTRGAPHVVFAHVPAQGVTPKTDAVIAASWFEIVAHAHGVGTCFAGYLMFALERRPELARSLGIPEGRVVPAALLAGVPKYRYRRMVPRDEPGVTYLDTVLTAGA